MAFQQVVRVYPSPTSFQVEAARVAAYGWAVATVTERQPPTSVKRVLALGIIGALVFRPKPELVVTYRREETGDARDEQAMVVFADEGPGALQLPAAVSDEIGALLLAAAVGLAAVVLVMLPSIVQYAVTGEPAPVVVFGANLGWLYAVVGPIAAVAFYWRHRAWRSDPSGVLMRADLQSQTFRRAAAVVAVWSVFLWAIFNLFGSV